jgi:hypothetical protein
VEITKAVRSGTAGLRWGLQEGRKWIVGTEVSGEGVASLAAAVESLANTNMSTRIQILVSLIQVSILDYFRPTSLPYTPVQVARIMDGILASLGCLLHPGEGELDVENATQLLHNLGDTETFMIYCTLFMDSGHVEESQGLESAVERLFNVLFGSATDDNYERIKDDVLRIVSPIPPPPLSLSLSLLRPSLPSLHPSPYLG